MHLDYRLKGQEKRNKIKISLIEAFEKQLTDGGTRKLLLIPIKRAEKRLEKLAGWQLRHRREIFAGMQLHDGRSIIACTADRRGMTDSKHLRDGDPCTAEAAEACQRVHGEQDSSGNRLQVCAEIMQSGRCFSHQPSADLIAGLWKRSQRK